MPLKRSCPKPIAQIVLAIFLTVLPYQLTAKSSAEDFGQNCTACHTIGGGRMVGPDLKNVSQRRERSWLLKMIASPKSMQLSGDPVFADLFREYRGVLMTNLPNMTPERVQDLLNLIEEESKLAKSKFAGTQLIDRPLLPQDAKDGEALFTGKASLRNGGPSCISCHSVSGLGGLGGGLLGPDLSSVFSKLGSENALAQWLLTPASPTMQPVFSKNPVDVSEIILLVAFLKNKAVERKHADSIARLSFLILGTVGVTFLFIIFDFIWKGRIRSVREKFTPAANPKEGAS